MKRKKCCGDVQETPYCPWCGEKLFELEDPEQLARYLESQRARTSAWTKRCASSPNLLEDEKQRRMAKHTANLQKWDAWIKWVRDHIRADEKTESSCADGDRRS